jgi:hypothetical protein
VAAVQCLTPTHPAHHRFPTTKHGTCKGDKEYIAFAFAAEIDGFNGKRTSLEKNPCLQSLSLAPKL